MEDTNSNLKPAKSKNPRLRNTKQRAADRLREKASQQACDARPKPVDIFGNPIEDIDAWMQDQDMRAQQRAAEKAAAEAPPEEPERRRPGLIARSLTALRLSRTPAA